MLLRVKNKYLQIFNINIKPSKDGIFYYDSELVWFYVYRIPSMHKRKKKYVEPIDKMES